MSYKIGIVGAARRHQGTGPFVARTFAQLGNTISGVIGTSQASLNETVTSLRTQHGIHTNGYRSLAELLNDQTIDILAICSPADTHLQYLQQGLANRLHLFCEKPLWWPSNRSAEFGRDQYEHKIHQLIETAKQNKRIIHINTQWPYTLRDFYRLHAADLTMPFKVDQFAMHLCPQNHGTQMLVDAASHGLSALYQLVGYGTLSDIVIEKPSGPEFENAAISFKYLHAEGTTQVLFGLTNSQELPKPASYQINGLSVNRNVTLPDYQIQLQSDRSTMNILDPLETSIRDFIAGIEAETECDDTALMLGAQHLFTLIDACR